MSFFKVFMVAVALYTGEAMASDFLFTRCEKTTSGHNLRTVHEISKQEASYALSSEDGSVDSNGGFLGVHSGVADQLNATFVGYQTDSEDIEESQYGISIVLDGIQAVADRSYGIQGAEVEGVFYWGEEVDDLVIVANGECTVEKRYSYCNKDLGDAIEGRLCEGLAKNSVDNDISCRSSAIKAVKFWQSFSTSWSIGDNIKIDSVQKIGKYLRVGYSAETGPFEVKSEPRYATVVSQWDFKKQECEITDIIDEHFPQQGLPTE